MSIHHCRYLSKTLTHLSRLPHFVLSLHPSYLWLKFSTNVVIGAAIYATMIVTTVCFMYFDCNILKKNYS